MASLIQTQLTANALLRKHGLADAGWTFKWDNAKRRGGACHYNTRHISMSKTLVPMWTDAEVEQTLLHEVAHALAGYEAHHGPKWERIARDIGFTRGTRTHSNPTAPKKWTIMCPKCGQIGQAHRRTRNAYHRRCGTVVDYVDNSLGVR
jgi:predicted SprT family Zn-dependent metalloprotease